MKRFFLATAMVAGIAAVTIPVWAHHSFQSEYDQSKPLTLVGTLTRVQQTNPHGWIFLDAKPSTPGGKVINWALETPGANVLNQNGFNRGVYQTLLETKEQVTVTAYAAIDGSKHAWAGGLTRADGRTVITLSGIPRQGGGGGGAGGARGGAARGGN
jgi:hypothetical protein